MRLSIYPRGLIHLKTILRIYKSSSIYVIIKLLKLDIKNKRFLLGGYNMEVRLENLTKVFPGKGTGKNKAPDVYAVNDVTLYL